MPTPHAVANCLLCLFLTLAARGATRSESSVKDHGSRITPQVLNLSGEWRFSLDAEAKGTSGQWFSGPLANRIQLPGILQAQGYGNDISTNTPWVLSLYDRSWFLREDYRPFTRPGLVQVPFLCQPPKHYIGPAWYQRDMEIPTAWAGRRIVLFLERPRWETTVWLDSREAGSNRSLVAPHEYDLGPVSPGRHQLTIRVDTRMVLPYRPDAHSVSDSLGHSWNGITGRIELRSTTPTYIQSAQVFPNTASRSAVIKIQIGTASSRVGSGNVSVGDVSTAVAWQTNGGSVQLEVPLGKDAALWDEFNPRLHRLTLRLMGDEADDSRELVFGLRDFVARGNQFLINGRAAHLRGTHHGGDFPLTGYPPGDVAYWKQLFLSCKDWGLNHVRFHSFCPPEAAFTAADEVGVYLQPECGMWNEISPGTGMERMLYAETERMIEAYGNHPSFVLLSPSNEPKGRWKQSLPNWVEHFRGRDPRRLYTTGTGWSLIDEPGPVTGADYLAVHRIGGNMLRGNSAWFGRDYSKSLRGVNVPVVSHELGQWCAYPDFSVIRKFTGYLRPGNFEIYRQSAAQHGLLEKNRDLARASGRFQLACYKEDIEANLRTPGLSGFQLLDLHDYVGQGTALVGLLDPFWESKGYVEAAEFRRFCSAAVPLARLRQRVFTTADPFEADLEVALYAAGSIPHAVVRWELQDRKGSALTKGAFDPKFLATGTNTFIGKIQVDLASLDAPQALKLVATVASGQSGVAANDWNLWLYAASTNEASASGVLITADWEAAKAALAKAGKVLFLPSGTDLDWTCPPLDNLPAFWNRLMNPGWSRMLGLWCDTNHPALAGFPSDAFCDWQWTDVVRRSRAINLDQFPRELRPIVQPIDDWNRNYRLGLIFECRVGAGKLMVCSADLEANLAQRPGARQLRRSLVAYMAGVGFQPGCEVPAETFERVFLDNLVMRRLGAVARGSGQAGNLIDGDPNTFWLAGGRGAAYPYEITIEFPKATAMSGLVLMPRQNHREHEGDIREYAITTSDDGSQWAALTRGTLVSTFDPQRVIFPGIVSTRFLRFMAVSGFGADGTAALGELAVIYAGPRLAAGKPGAPEFKRARSASEDVDEGPPN